MTPLLPPVLLLPYHHSNLGHSCCSKEPLWWGGGGVETEAPFSCDLRRSWGSSKPSLGSLTRHIPQIRETLSQVPWNGNSLPNLARSWKIYLSIPSWIPSLSLFEAACRFDLSLDARNKGRVWKCPETTCKYLEHCAWESFPGERSQSFSKRPGIPMLWEMHTTGAKPIR